MTSIETKFDNVSQLHGSDGKIQQNTRGSIEETFYSSKIETSDQENQIIFSEFLLTNKNSQKDFFDKLDIAQKLKLVEYFQRLLSKIRTKADSIVDKPEYNQIKRFKKEKKDFEKFKILPRILDNSVLLNNLSDYKNDEFSIKESELGIVVENITAEKDFSNFAKKFSDDVSKYLPNKNDSEYNSSRKNGDLVNLVEDLAKLRNKTKINVSINIGGQYTTLEELVLELHKYINQNKEKTQDISDNTLEGMIKSANKIHNSSTKIDKVVSNEYSKELFDSANDKSSISQIIKEINDSSFWGGYEGLKIISEKYL